MSETTKKPIKGTVHLTSENQQEVELRFLTSYQGGVEGSNLHIIIPGLEESIQGIVINHNNLLLLREELNQLPH